MKELIEKLHAGGYSCVIANGDCIRTFTQRGVADLYDLLVQDADFLKGASVADKVIGKAAASLMVLGGVKEVYTHTISQPALLLLQEAGINVGSYAISIAEWSNANYIIVNAGTAQGTYVIDPKPIEVDVAANAALVYDNTQKAASWDIASGEFVAGEGLEDVTVTLIYSGTANDASTPAAVPRRTVRRDASTVPPVKYTRTKHSGGCNVRCTTKRHSRLRFTLRHAEITNPAAAPATAVPAASANESRSNEAIADAAR